MESNSISDARGVLVVGAGFIAGTHLGALRNCDGARIAGVVDIDATRAADLARRNGGVHWTSDLSEALAWPGVEAVILCTPNHTHLPIGLDVAAAGKHMLIEKPLATTVADARRLAVEYERRGLVLAVAHTHRFYDYARFIKAELDAGTLGRPVLVRLAVLGGWIWTDWSAWVIDPAQSGGHALHNGTHLLDLVTWWVGERPSSVYARGRRQTAAELDIYDYLEMVVQFPGGATAECEISRAHRPASFSHREVLVQGTAGQLNVPWDAEGNLIVDEHGSALLAPPAGDGFAGQLQAWLDTIRGRPGGGGVDAAAGVLAVALAVAAERSLATGLPVALDDVWEDPA